MQFLQTQGPSGPGWNGGMSLRFCAPKMLCPDQGVTLVMGSGADSPCQGEMARRARGGRERRHGGRGGTAVPADCARPLAPLKVNWPAGPREGGLGHWFLSHRWERNLPPAGGEIPCEKLPKRRVREAAPYRREQNLRGRRGRAPALPGCGKTSPATKSPAHLIP